jgi:glycosyltransferase involved in cell wall biosynthesis
MGYSPDAAISRDDVRIAVDARPAVSVRRTGVGHYTRELILRLPVIDPGAEYLAWHLPPRRLFRPWNRPHFPRRSNLKEVRTPFPAGWFHRAALRWDLPRLEWLLRFDVLFAPNFLPPPTRRRRLVLTVHDLAFRRFPDTAPLATRRWLARLEESLRRAAQIIVPSEATRVDLLELFRVDSARVTVVHHGVDAAAFHPSSSQVEEIRRRFGIKGRYLLFLGGIEPRKNLPRLVRAFAGLRSDINLVVAGSSVPWNPEGRTMLDSAVRALPEEAQRRLTFTGYVTDPDRGCLLAGAEALVLPSRYEGFGFPLLEAMAAGTPVVTSNVSSLPEVAGNAALYVDPEDEESIADGLRRIIEDDGLRSRLLAAGAERVQAFTWETCARATAEVLHRAAVH